MITDSTDVLISYFGAEKEKKKSYANDCGCLNLVQNNKKMPRKFFWSYRGGNFFSAKGS